MNLFNLFARITLDTADYDKGLKESEKKGKSWGEKTKTTFKSVAKVVTAFYGVLSSVSGVLVKLSTNAMAFGDDIDKTSQKLGLSSESYQKWSIAVEQAGLDVATLKTGVRELTKFTQGLTEGQADNLVALDELGLEYEDFINLSVEDQLKDIVEAFQDMEEGTDKTRLAQQIFGQRTYQELMPLLNQEKGSIDELFESYENLGLIISDEVTESMADLQDKLTLTKRAFKVLATNAVYEVAPSLDLIMDGLIGIANGSEDAGDKILKGFLGIVDKVVEKAPKVIDMLGNFLIGIVDGITPMLPALVKSLFSVLEKLLLKVTEPDTLTALIKAAFDIITAIIEGLLYMDWGQLIINLFTLFSNVMTKLLPEFVLNLSDLLFSLFTTGKGWTQIGKIGLAIAQTIINNLIGGIEGGINLVIKTINKLLEKINNVTGVLKISAIPTIDEIAIPRVSWYANGGMLDDIFDFTKKVGSVAVMGENGAEIVAQGARGTGVANVEQISDAQYMAMDKYGFKEIIADAVSAIVNGIVGGLSYQSGGSIIDKITLKIGERDFKAYIVEIVDSVLNQRGRKTLNTITAY